MRSSLGWLGAAAKEFVSELKTEVNDFRAAGPSTDEVVPGSSETPNPPPAGYPNKDVEAEKELQAPSQAAAGFKEALVAASGEDDDVAWDDEDDTSAQTNIDNGNAVSTTSASVGDGGDEEPDWDDDGENNDKSERKEPYRCKEPSRSQVVAVGAEESAPLKRTESSAESAGVVPVATNGVTEEIDDDIVGLRRQVALLKQELSLVTKERDQVRIEHADLQTRHQKLRATHQELLHRVGQDVEIHGTQASKDVVNQNGA